MYTYLVPALECRATSSTNGNITVTWSYTHTGGLPLTSVSVSYSKLLEASTVSRQNPVTISNISATSVVVPNLEAGFEYVFDITAENSEGSMSISCGPILHLIGESTHVYIFHTVH